MRAGPDIECFARTRRKTELAPPLFLSSDSLMPTPVEIPRSWRRSVEAKTPVVKSASMSVVGESSQARRLPFHPVEILSGLPVTSKRLQVSQPPLRLGIG